MSELGDIHEKINSAMITLARIDERMEFVVTSPGLTDAIAAHKESCRLSITPKQIVAAETSTVEETQSTNNGNQTKVIMALVTALGVLGTVIALLVGFA